jgi:hypothetical protein
MEPRFRRGGDKIRSERVQGNIVIFEALTARHSFNVATATNGEQAMKKTVSGALAVGLAGALMVASAAPSEARWRGGGAVAAGAVIGLAAGAIAASALAPRTYYGPGYGYGYYDTYAGGYAYEPSYSYPAYGYGYSGYSQPVYAAPAPVYAEPAPVYAAPAPVYAEPTYGYASTRTYVAPTYAAAPAGGRCRVVTDPDKNLGYWRAC